MNKLLVITLLLTTIATFGQKEENLLLVADSTWGKEVIHLPFGFAPEIDFVGYEDIRFAKGWGNIESSEFWSYVFVWNINLQEKPNAKFFQDNLKLYFDGLMKAVNKEKDKIIPEAKVTIIAKEETNGITKFTGKIITHDSFRTKKLITLQVSVESFYCKKTKKYMPLFRFSPQPFEHQIWKKLHNVKLKENYCQNK
ncbi:hypothetical protein [Tenacibaculum halocynthiae]|uniref:hypothetical protein n=1 Tax=Tenacibaculum halocynthiae TaxID=1254437 RepID=UPI00263A1F88|nr:hypothetical protein [uncultured Tenacibaculum sp.]